MFAGTGNAGTAATSGSAGWDRGSWSRRNSFAGSRDTNRFRLSSKNWKLWRRLSRRLSNGERRRKVDHKGAATFNGVPGILVGWSTENHQSNLAPAQILLIRNVLVDCDQNIKTGFFGGFHETSVFQARQIGEVGGLTIVAGGQKAQPLVDTFVDQKLHEAPVRSAWPAPGCRRSARRIRARRGSPRLPRLAPYPWSCRSNHRRRPAPRRPGALRRGRR